MARIRTIKPGFWKHEDLSALPECTHMLAGALLNYADDDGYFNANPGLVKAECAPLRETAIPVAEMLRQLCSIGYIELGSGADGKSYGRIVKFDEHQVVNHKTTSKIKALFKVHGNSGNATGRLPEPYHPEGKGREGNKEGNKEEEGKGKEVAREGALAPDPIRQALDAWNDVAIDLALPVAQFLNSERKAKLRQRLDECGGLDGWAVAMSRIRGSPFLRGENPRGWKADLDFVLQKKSFTRLMEGSYERPDTKPLFGNGFAELAASGQLGALGRDGP